ncbi:MAG: YihY/virulence factor BrkB family protein, partial [Pseudomonadota bacterium]|nr:YihY/virulence factor BrkB family protein [Pseudomonadota bacterium]
MTAGTRGSLADWWKMIKRALAAWSDDYAPSMGAALSYYSVFSMGPLLLIVVSVAGLVFGQEAVRGEIFGQLRSLMGEEGAKGVEALLAGASKPEHGIIGIVLGVAVLVVGATTVFGELQDALDRIWRAPARPADSGLWGLVRARFLAFGMVLGVAFLLMVSLVLNAALAALGKWWNGAFAGWELIGQVLGFIVGYLVTTAAFAAIYKWIPRVPVRWHDVWLGAAVTSALFNVGRFLIALYIGKTGLASGFGAAGSVAVIFVWVYYSAQIFLLGAEFTWVYANTFGSMRKVDGPAPTAPEGPR